MNLIKGVNCVHYDQKDKIAKNKLYDIVKEKNIIGHAIDNQVAIEFIDDHVKVIKSNDNKNAYEVTFINGNIVEKTLRN